MKQPSLRLEYYFFPTVSVKANIDYKPDNAQTSAGSYEISSVVGVNKENENKFQLQLDIKAPTKENQNFSHEIELSVVGYFQVDPSFPDKTKLLSITGSSILYSAARDFLLTITSRGPWPAFMLPTMSFIPDPDENKRAEEPITPPRKTARKKTSLEKKKVSESK